MEFKSFEQELKILLKLLYAAFKLKCAKVNLKYKYIF